MDAARERDARVITLKRGPSVYGVVQRFSARDRVTRTVRGAGYPRASVAVAFVPIKYCVQLAQVWDADQPHTIYLSLHLIVHSEDDTILRSLNQVGGRLKRR